MRVKRSCLRKILPGLVLLAAVLACGGVPAAAFQPSKVSADDPGSRLDEGWQHGAFIEIFVRGYRDSDGDGIGDLRGLTQSLDYLHDLGIRGIWLMPVTRSLDHDHGYAVNDYRDIEPAYGSLADFDDLLTQAHARGIGVIFDYVINHAASDSPLFAAASSSPTNPYRSWFMWREQAPVGWKIMGKDPWVKTSTGAYLAQFSPTMPDFNLLNPEVMAFHEDNLRFWLNRGVDGFRFDAVTHLVENGPDAWYDQPADYQLMSQVSALVRSYARRYVVCEATENAQRYAAANVCGGAFAIDRAPQLVDAARGKPEAIRAVAEYFLAAPQGMATMISNHDLFAGERLWDQVQGDQAQYRLAAASYLLQPGTPFIYYGEEIGMSAAAGLQGDRKLRTPMSWTGDPVNAGFSQASPYRVVAANAAAQNVASQLAAPDSLLAYYKALLRLRNRYPSIARGSYETPFVEGQVMGFTRRLADETTLVIVNYGTRPADLLLRGRDAALQLEQVFPDQTKGALLKAGADQASTLRIGPQSVLVFASKPK